MKSMDLFHKTAVKICKRYFQKRGDTVLKKQSAYDMKNLYPGKNAEERLFEYYVGKVRTVVVVTCVGVLLALVCFAKEYMETIIVDDVYIQRNENGEGEILADVTAHFADGSKEEVTIQVGERRFGDTELAELYALATEKLEHIIFAEGDGFDCVQNDMNFPDAVEGFPFRIQWESSDYSCVDYDGSVNASDVNREGVVVNVTAIFSYYDFMREYVFSVHVYPPVLSAEKVRKNALTESLTQSEQKTIHEEQFVLPNRVDGQDVTWEEQKENSAISVLMLTFVTAAVLFFAKDQDLHKQVLLKEEEMYAGYPEIVNRLVLYVGAGMTVRNAFRKIAIDYKAAEHRRTGKQIKKGYAYREMLFTCYEMDSGVAEGDAYERFGRRCGLQQYIKLATLLVQNMQKGNSTLLVQLKEEAENAFVGRMSQARKKGEEAGTKLLMPMMLLLGMVMILIMIPAFSSFGV